MCPRYLLMVFDSEQGRCREVGPIDGACNAFLPSRGVGLTINGRREADYPLQN